MSLLQTWYNLSDYEVEEQVSDCLSFMQACGLRLQDSVPAHSVLARFRGGENGDHKVAKLAKGGVDQEGAWVKKGGKLYYGYKRHVAVASRGELVLSVHTTKGNKHDT